MNRVREQSCGGQDHGSTGSGSGSSSKRRRVSLACSACRARKSRCDGVRPTCSACEELGFDCVYVQSASSTNMIVGKPYLVGLEDRLKAVEEEIHLLKGSRSSRQLRFEDQAPPPETVSSDGQGGLEVNSASVHDVNLSEDFTDGMGAIIFSEEENFAFFGPSSNIAFTRQISQSLIQLDAGNAWSEPDMGLSQLSGGVMSLLQPASPTGQASHSHETAKINIYAVPSEDVTKKLLSHYFSTTGRLFPYLHEGSFWETYEEIRRNNFTKIRRTWLGLFNIILALATSTGSGTNIIASEKVRKSDLYYQRAVGLCEKHILRASSLEAVQFLLVMGQYLQGTQKSVQAWSIHGLTVKAAFQLGLHSAAAAKRFSPFEQEIRKRTWYGCVVLDRTLSMTFGRPANIPDEYVRLDLPKLLESDISNIPDEDSVTTNSITFFNNTITLYKIMWNVISILYGGNIGCDESLPVLDSVSQFFKLEQELLAWEQKLPPHQSLRKSHEIPSDASDPNEKFRIILTLRHHNLRILLHRSMLVRFLELVGQKERRYQEPVLSQVGSNSIHVCTQLCLETISIVSSIVKSGDARRGMLGAWWFTLYYIHEVPTSSTSATATVEEMRAGVVDAAQALQHLDNENHTVNTCAKYLQKLAALVYMLTSAPHPGTAQTLSMLNGNLALQDNQVEGMDATSGMMTGFSPFGLGAELGEFILDGDLEFLNQVTLPMNPNV
ncbi:related to C6 transcription factor [Phialocephala subalpina]|uniref:Related to C6 transcription factor n=1 Tax=Phialocephala subalpina TaxID=576137 RepID=A0A1L7XPL2_9HELO|nr:related to C6 transcription factor [Phialocephala subalpina]